MVAERKWLRHRGVLVGAVLMALVVASSAVGVWTMYRLPDPEHARGRDLMRWLVTRDLREETQETHRALVKQLELYLQDAEDLGGAAAEMNDERRRMLKANVAVLLPEWLRLGAERHEQLAPEQRPALLAEQLVLVERVSELNALWHVPVGGAEEANPIFALVAAVEGMVAEANSDERPQLDRYVRAMKLQWFATVDLSQLSGQSLAVLASRVEDELRGGLQLDDSAADFDSVRSRQLWQNVDLIAETWFRRAVETYARVSPAERSAHMQQLVADVTSWPLVARQLAPTPHTMSGDVNLFGVLLNSPMVQAMKQMAAVKRRVNGWIRRAPQASQPQMRQFVDDASSAMRKRYFKRLLPG